LAEADPAGNLRVVGRATDLIVLPSGLLVWPEDVEDVLRADPAVEDAAVQAVPAAGGGMTLHAYLLPAAGTGRGAALATIVATCNGRLAQPQRVATASWWPEADFPRTSLGKVRRHMLPPPARAAATVRVDAVLAADDPVAQAVAAVARAAVVDP